MEQMAQPHIYRASSNSVYMNLYICENIIEKRFSEADVYIKVGIIFKHKLLLVSFFSLFKISSVYQL